LFYETSKFLNKYMSSTIWSY